MFMKTIIINQRKNVTFQVSLFKKKIYTYIVLIKCILIVIMTL